MTVSGPPDDAPLLQVHQLSVGFSGPSGIAAALNAISFTLASREVLGIVGETGAGKSILARSIIGLLPGSGRITSGDVMFAGRSLLTMPESQYRRMRGGRISLIGTNAKALLDPVTPIGRQIVRIIRTHVPGSGRTAAHKAVELLRSVGIGEPEQWAKAYPHELSGGMAQRAVIAMALAGEPELLLADDPTLGLDAAVQVEVLDLILQQSRARRCAVILITHDLGIVAQYCDRIGVMKSGRLIELGAVDEFLRRTALPHSSGLLAAASARPTLAGCIAAGRPAGRPLLQVRQLRKIFPATGERGEVRAVDGVDFEIGSGQTLAMVGESGSGKTTVGQCLLRLLPSTEGQVLFDGTDITRLTARQFRPFRRKMQMVFQESYLALNPRWRVADLIGEPLAMLASTTRSERARHVARLLEVVQLPASLANATPQQLTAGEQKRVGIARALATDPAFIVFDEPTTALDVTVRAQIIELIRDLQLRAGLTALVITHDLNSVRSLAHHVVVMNRGRVVECAETEVIFSRPTDEYTRTLLASELPISRAGAVSAVRPAGTGDLPPSPLASNGSEPKRPGEKLRASSRV
jgi:ABC-type glutathione transport system ATPase component